MAIIPMKKERLEPRFWSVKQLTSELGVSRSTLHRMVKDGRIAAPTKLSARRVGWSDYYIQEWLRNHVDAIVDAIQKAA